jgi:pimeloyl-ACP methyl ester carboxylesterase
VSPVRTDEACTGGERVTAVHRRNLKTLMFANAAAIDETALAVQEANVSLARFRRGFTSRPDWLCQALSAVRLPVLGVWGSNDALDDDVTLRLRALRAQVQHADVHVIEGSGHWVGYESFKGVNAILQEWVSGKSKIWNISASI